MPLEPTPSEALLVLACMVLARRPSSTPAWASRPGSTPTPSTARSGAFRTDWTCCRTFRSPSPECWDCALGQVPAEALPPVRGCLRLFFNGLW